MYDRDPQLRCKGEQIEYTREMIQEYLKCKEDILYFAEKYFKIISFKGEHCIELREYQRRMLKAMTVKDEKGRRHVCMVAARQIGKTTISTVYLLHYILFNEKKTVAVLANREKTAIEIISKVKLAYRSLPLWLQQGIDDQNGGWTKTSIGLESGCRVVASSTAGSAIRGFTINTLLLDEFAFVPPEIADAFISSVYPTITRDPESKIIMVSTPNGLNHFYDFFRSAVTGDNNFVPIKVNWWEVDGQDEEWKKGVIRDIGAQRFAQEYSCKFLGSSSTLVDSDVLERLKPSQPIGFQYEYDLSIFEYPDYNAHYIMGVDSSGGTGGDFSIIQVLKINSYNDVVQVATYSKNSIAPYDFAEVCIAVSEYYNNCEMIIENNEMGAQVAERVWYELECDRVLNTDAKGIGTRSTKRSKLVGCMLTKRWIEDGYLKLNCAETIRQLGLFEEVTPNSFKGPRLDHDDQVMALIWAIYYLQTPFYTGDVNSVRTSIKSIYKIVPDAAADKALLQTKRSQNRDGSDIIVDNINDESDADSEGYRPPLFGDGLDHDDESFAWPEDLD